MSKDVDMKITIFQYIVKIGTYPIKNPQTANSNNKKDNGWNISTGKKIAIVLGIVVIALLLFSFIYNSTQPDNKVH